MDEIFVAEKALRKKENTNSRENEIDERYKMKNSNKLLQH